MRTTPTLFVMLAVIIGLSVIVGCSEQPVEEWVSEFVSNSNIDGYPSVQAEIDEVGQDVNPQPYHLGDWVEVDRNNSWTATLSRGNNGDHVNFIACCNKFPSGLLNLWLMVTVHLNGEEVSRDITEYNESTLQNGCDLTGMKFRLVPGNPWSLDIVASVANEEGHFQELNARAVFNTDSLRFEFDETWPAGIITMSE